MVIDDGSNGMGAGMGVRSVGSGAKALRVGPADNDVAPAFTLTRGELAAVVSEAVKAALAAQAPKPLLVDKQILAHLIGCSAAHVDNMRKQGMPTVMVGMNVRFEPDDVMAWLRGRKS
jgi:hypothetical protein